MKQYELLDFSCEKIESEPPKMDNSNVQAGCWGDSGSDWANNC
jgi:hypothetical protein